MFNKRPTPKAKPVAKKPEPVQHKVVAQRHAGIEAIEKNLEKNMTPEATELLRRIHKELGAFLAGGSLGSDASRIAADIKAFLGE
jgi:hypothetical protein